MSASRSIESLGGMEYWRASARATARTWREMLEPGGIPKNVASGLTIALVAIPLNLALAIACGLSPAVGLVSGLIAGVLAAVLGGARLQVTGPEVALAPICVEIVSRYGVEGLIVTTFMAGAMQIAMGVLRVGRFIHAIPVPVVGGFMAAVGFLVLDAQLPRLLGLPADVRLLTDIRSFDVLGQIVPQALVIGLVVIALFAGLPKLSKAVPAPLVAVVVAIGATQLLELDVPMVASIDAGFPRPEVPPFAGVDLHALFPEALALAMLASIDSLLCAVSIEARTGGERTRTDQELVAQGFANMASACFGGMPVAAAVVRSMAAVESGATTRLAPLVQSIGLGVVLLVLAPFVGAVPVVALAGILLVVGVRLVDVRALRAMVRVAPFEALVFVVTAAGILITDFVVGVGVGIVAALVHFARQQRQHAQPLARTGVVAPGVRSGPEAADARGLYLVGPLFFGAQADIDDAVREATEGDLVVVDVSRVTSVDVSGAMALAKALRRAASDGTNVMIHSAGRALDPALRFFLDECRHEGLELVEDAERAGPGTFTARSSIPPVDRPIRIDADVTLPTA